MTPCIVKNLVGLILTLFMTLSTNGFSQTGSHPKWKFPMVPSPDSGTVLNKDRADKVMKIANYTVDHHQINIGNNPTDNEGKPFQFFKTKFSIDSVTYSIMVSNPQTREYSYGFLTISMNYQSKTGSETEIMIIDERFDGIFNFGMKTVGSYDAFGKKIVDYKQSLMFQNNSDRKDGLENGPFFQNIGDKAIEYIIDRQL